MDPYLSCTLCPRQCRADRTKGAAGYCRQPAGIRAAAALLHYGEEPPVTGTGGSGTIFFSGCTLQCSYCQNCQLSRDGMGIGLTPEQLADIFLLLQNAGAENVNLVTATHFSPGIEEAFNDAASRGFSLPLVWNSSGFESPGTMEALNRIVDIYLPDIKTVSEAFAASVYNTPGYASAAKEAVRLMTRAKPLLTEGDRLRRGVIVRHLVLPGLLEITREVFAWYAEHIGGDALFSLLFQYTPAGGPVPRRRVTPEEYETVLSWLDEFGIEEGFVQELEGGVDWFPDFSKPAPFPSSDSKVVWHWRSGNPASL